MPGLATGELLDAFKEMTLLELSGFIKEFEAAFGVTALTQSAAAPVVPAEAEAEAEADEQAEFDLIIEAVGDRKIQVIKEVRSLTQLGIKEAKDAVDGVPATLLKGVSKDTAEKAREALQKAGATVTLK
jgi:large subunit ribosomal protein L7/L12